MNTLVSGFMLTLHDTRSIPDSMNIPKMLRYTISTALDNDNKPPDK